MYKYNIYGPENFFYFPPQVDELNLDNCRSTQVEGLNENYTKLESLSMINVGLTSLKGFPKLAALQRVSLCISVRVVIS